jgi:UDP-GlcNAc3NAcA epimerase
MAETVPAEDAAPREWSDADLRILEMHERAQLKILTVVGARPQFIKAAVVSREFARRPGIQEIIVHTGQHFDDNMSDIFFREMQIPLPDYCLDIHSMSHGAMTGRMLEKTEEVLVAETPDCLLVYGDTNSTLAGALAAKKMHIRVVHVEAGLRSHNMNMPEEINRVLTDRISDVLCCPTDAAVRNLAKEGFDGGRCTIVKTGDVMQDAALHYGEIAAKHSQIIARLGLSDKEYGLCTVHRAENTDDPLRLRSIMDALSEISRETTVVIPVHPRTAKILGKKAHPPGLLCIDPVGYLDMLELVRHASLVLTDSGGLQKEAFFFAKPCLTLRDETEWVELVDHGFNRLVGADGERILANFRAFREARLDFSLDLYGGGKAGKNVVDALLGT